MTVSASGTAVIRATGRVALLATLLGSGGYVAVYLYRWEWHRALIAGVIFLAALVVTLALAIMSRLERLEARLDTLNSGPIGTAQRDGHARSPDVAAPAQEFRWLETRADTHVFIPILLGAGILVSLVAALVERAAVFVGGGSRGTPANTQSAGSRALRTATSVVAVAAVVVVATMVLRNTTMWAPEPPRPGTRAIVVDVIATIDRPAPPEETLAATAAFCRISTHASITVERVERVSEHRARLVVSPLVDPTAQRRYEGCLEDAILHQYNLDVISVSPPPED